MTPEDIEHLQTIGRDAQNARKEFILKDDQSAAWEHITTLIDARIDFVLDNGKVHDSGWQPLPESAGDFETAAIRICELISKGDQRIGKETTKSASLG